MSELRKEEGSAPETAQVATFNVQLEESALRRAATCRENAGKNLNSFIERAIEEKLAKVEEAAQSIRA